MWEVKPDVPVPLLPPFDGVHIIRWLQEDPSPFLTKHTTFLSLMDGLNLFIIHQHQVDNSVLPQAGSSSVTVMRAPPPPSTVDRCCQSYLGVATPAPSHPPDRPNQAATEKQTQPLHSYSRTGILLCSAHCSAGLSWAWGRCVVCARARPCPHKDKRGVLPKGYPKELKKNQKNKEQ